MPSFEAEREAYDGTRCTFQPRNGGWSDRCREAAVWGTPASTSTHWTFIERRCQRHYDIDARTEAKRGWASSSHERLMPFDPEGERALILARVTAKEVEAETMFWAHLTDAVAERDLEEVRRLVKGGRR